MRGSAQVPALRGSRSPGPHTHHCLGAPGPLPAAREAREAGSAPQKRARSLGSTLPGQVPGRSAWLTGSEGCKPGHGADRYLSSEKRLQVGTAVQAEPGTTCPSSLGGSGLSDHPHLPAAPDCSARPDSRWPWAGLQVPRRKALSRPQPLWGPRGGLSGARGWASQGSVTASGCLSGLGCGGGHGAGLRSQMLSELRAQS